MDGETDEQYYGCSNEERYMQTKSEYYLAELEFIKFKRKVKNMSIIDTFVSAIKDDIHGYEQDMPHFKYHKLMKRLEKYKDDFHGLYRNRDDSDAREEIEKFDKIYEELIGNIK